MEETGALARCRPKGEPSADALLEGFVDYLIEREIELYPAQEEAVLEILAGHHVILNTPTGSGKSLVALAMHFMAFCRGQRSFYTSPVKALVSEKFFALCESFGAENVGMMTGDASINRDAPVICCTAEILANLALREGDRADVAFAILDEFHYYGDRDRGMAWQVPLIALPHTTFLLMSATLGDTRDISRRLERHTRRHVALVRSTQRPVPLTFEYVRTPLHETIPGLLQVGRQPIYLVNFTHRECAEQAQNLMSIDVAAKSDKKEIAEAIQGFRFDSPYGKEMQRYLRHGIGLHHAGLLPKYRLLVEQLAQQGLLKVISGTDTLGVGVNIPIRSVLFTRLSKYDGRKVRLLPVRNFQQIAGRAGRKGFDDQGWVVCQAPEHVIANLRRSQQIEASGKKKKFVKQQPPQGYVAYNEDTMWKLVEGESESLSSRFRIEHGTILNVLQQPPRDDRPGGNYAGINELIEASHEPPAMLRRHRRMAADLFRSLRGAGVVEIEPRPTGAGGRVVLSKLLQRDFSLFHAHALYVYETIRLLDPESDEYALDVVTLVESIQEDPGVVLAQQLRRVKTIAIAKMKAEGIEYDERMERLETLQPPRPREEFLLDAWDAFCETHPWATGEGARPKSIARDIYERYATFPQYVKELDLARAEGVLLRYLGQTYKMLLQTVPKEARSDALMDVIGYLRAMIQRVDASLVQAWERLVDPDSTAPIEGDDDVDGAIDPLDPAADPRAFQARVRAEMHRLVKALSEEDYEEAEACVRRPNLHEEDKGFQEWDATAFHQAVAPFFETYDRMIFDHRARFPQHTHVRRIAPRLWQVTQVLLDPDEENTWHIEGRIDLRVPSPPDDPWIAIRQIGE